MGSGATRATGPDLVAMTWPEAAAMPTSVLLVPLGSTEQHGPHLPIGTDTIIAAAWTERVAERIAGAVVAPAIPVGSAGEHQAFPGTLSIGGPALIQVVIELARSAASAFPRLALLSGHAGNHLALERAVEQLRVEGHDVIHRVPSWPAHLPGADRVPIDAHAGRTETSLMLHLRPDLVHLDRAEPGQTRPLSELMGRLTTEGVASVSANGILGDPVGASGDEGRRLLDDLVTRTVDELAHWLASDGDTTSP